MNRWIWIALGVVGFAFTRRIREQDDAFALAPLEGSLVVTPHGHFGAARKGPPVHAHQGIDLAARPGSFIRAIATGTVVATNPGLGGLVRKLKLDVPTSFASGKEAVAFVVYADLGSALREPGERVAQGEPIAVVGRRGFFHFATKRVAQGREEFFDPALSGLGYRATNERVSA